MPVSRDGPQSRQKAISTALWKPKVEALSGRHPERSRRGEPAAEILSEAKDLTAKSLFRNTLPISPLNSKIWRDFPPNPMIPKDRGEGGGGYPYVGNLCQPLTRSNLTEN